MNDNIVERGALRISGWFALLVWLGGAGAVGWQIFTAAIHQAPLHIGVILAIPVLIFLGKGFIVLQPNMASVMTFFGSYSGTLRDAGFSWTNPLYLRQKVSLRIHNITTPTLKVNDRAGNPIEVAAVVVWRVTDSARAVFDVENYQAFVAIQAESAVRRVASTRWYDGDDNGHQSLRGDLDAVAKLLLDTIQEHVIQAGLEILEARIAHLAYAPEIASAMLRRQQAQAVVAARSYIVEGAVGMVRQGLERLEAEGVVKLDDRERVRLATNLMTVLVSENETMPVLPLNKE